MFNEIENIFYYFVYSIVLSILSILLLLIISEQFRKTTFAWIFTSKLFTEWGKRLFTEHRKVFLKDFTQLKPKNPNEKLVVLEVGTGAGANFEIYPQNCKLIALDYNEKFKNDFIKNVSKHPNIEFVEYIEGSIEDMSQIEDNSIDVVLVTHVFCSVPDTHKGVLEIKRVLKKGGKFFFMEHVGYKAPKGPTDQFWSIAQYIMTPLWKIIFCGCELHRPTWVHLEMAGFEANHINYSYPKNIPHLLRPQIWGFLQK